MDNEADEIQVENFQDPNDNFKGAAPLQRGWSSTLRPDGDRYRNGMDGHLMDFDDGSPFFGRVPKHVRRAGYRRSRPLAGFKGRS